MVPIPTSFLTAKTPMSEVKSSGADEPAACVARSRAELTTTGSSQGPLACWGAARAVGGGSPP